MLLWVAISSKMAILPVMLFIANLLLCFYQISSTTDTITQFKPLHDGSTLASNDGTFELGFFSPGSSTNRYVGIWYKNIPVRVVVWVANRDHPITDNSSVLSISKEGNLVLLSKNQTLLWSTNSSTEALSPIVQLLDTGNLVLREENNKDDSFLWQSFDHPCDTLLSGMKLGWDLKTGLNRRLTAWKSWDDPAPGNFTWGTVLTSNPEMILWKGPIEYQRSGPWNGNGFNGAPLWKGASFVDHIWVNNIDEVYYTYILKNKSVISITYINQTLYLRQRITWNPENNTWKHYQSAPRDYCDTYNPCGPYGNCITNESPNCQCLEGFKPKSPQNWDAMDWTQGCVRTEPWRCKVKDKDGFRKFPGLKLPDTTHSWVNKSMTLEDCKARCMENCSCTAYANLDVSGDGSGCAIWFGDLLDLRVSDRGQDLYVRMATPWTGKDCGFFFLTSIINLLLGLNYASFLCQVGNADAKHKKKKKTTYLVITITLPIVIVLLLIFSYIYKTQRKCQGMKFLKFVSLNI